MSMQAALADADSAYNGVKKLATGIIGAQEITQANIAYLRIKTLAIEAHSRAEKIPALQAAITGLSAELIRIMAITPAMEALMTAVNGLSSAIMDALSVKITFETCDTD